MSLNWYFTKSSIIIYLILYVSGTINLNTYFCVYTVKEIDVVFQMDDFNLFRQNFDEPVRNRIDQNLLPN